MCMDVTVYWCDIGILQILIFFVFKFNICNGQKLLPIPGIVDQVTGTNKLVTGFPLMPERAKIVVRYQYHGLGHWYQQIGNVLFFNARYMC
jgi:hypothetical protein